MLASGNQLAMDDWRDKSASTLCTFNGHAMLHFNADVAGHRVNRQCEQKASRRIFLAS